MAEDRFYSKDKPIYIPSVGEIKKAIKGAKSAPLGKPITQKDLSRYEEKEVEEEKPEVEIKIEPKPIEKPPERKGITEIWQDKPWKNLPKQTLIKVYRTTSNQTIATGTETKVQWNAEEFDIFSEFDLTTNYRFTTTTPGYYNITANITWSGLPAGDKHYWALIKKNGSIVAEDLRHEMAAGDVDSVGALTNMVHTMLYLNKNDYIEIYVEHDGGANTDIYKGSNRSYLIIYRIN